MLLSMLEAQRLWRVRPVPDDLVAELEHDLGLSALTARLLAGRGIDSASTAEHFLRKRLQDLLPPDSMRDMPVAAKRFAQAIEQRERILIHGDYDVDGSTATVLLKQFCRCLSHDAVGWIPDRRIDGYGLSEASLEAVRQEQAQLMVTVDCGIADQGWAARIEETGCQVIITDHHLPQDQLPRCTAVCNPNQPDCRYPDKGLAGVGVAWKLCWATAKVLCGSDRVTDRLREFLLDSLALVAIGTVADCAPLAGENRILVHHGLQALAASRNPGLRAILAQTRLEEGPITANDVGWKIGPLLNASGRLGSALRNVSLLCAENIDEATHLLREIVGENEERRRLTMLLADEIAEEIERNHDYEQRLSLVFSGDGWHQGVVGIVASRLSERYQKPTAVIGIVDGIAKGSLRTVPGVHLGQAIEACRDHLLAGGGHAMAAGICLEPERVPDFIQAFEDHFQQHFPAGLPAAGTDYDADTGILSLQNGFMKELQSLEPFGTGNPAPVIRVRGCRFAGRPDLFGRDGKHLRGAITDAEGGMQQMIAWSAGSRLSDFCRVGAQFDLLLKPEINHWRGRSQLQLLFVDGCGL